MQHKWTRQAPLTPSRLLHHQQERQQLPPHSHRPLLLPRGPRLNGYSIPLRGVAAGMGAPWGARFPIWPGGCLTWRASGCRG